MKGKLALVAMCVALFGSSVASAQEARAVRVDIFGRGPAVDARAFRQVRTLIASEVVENNVLAFMVGGFGIEGGFSACVELRSARAASDLYSRLRRVQPEPMTTSYAVTLEAECGGE
jgi:hypothetical protein